MKLATYPFSVISRVVKKGMILALTTVFFTSNSAFATSTTTDFIYTIGSGTANWTNGQAFGDFSISDGGMTEPSGTVHGDMYDSGFFFEVCPTGTCAPNGAYTTYTGAGTANSSTGFYTGAKATTAGLDITASYKFSKTIGAVRMLVQIDNTTASPITKQVRIRTNLGSDTTSRLKYESAYGSALSNYYTYSTTAYTSSSYWFITSDSSGTTATDTGGDPIASFVMGQSGAISTPTTIFTNDDVYTMYTITIPANSTRYLMAAGGLGGINPLSNSLGSAYTGVTTYLTSYNNWPTDLKSDLTGAQLGGLLNWVLSPATTLFNSAQTTPTKTTSAISYTMTMSQNITGLAGTDFSNAGSATGCSFSSDTSTGTSFIISVSGCGEGTLRPQLLANSIMGTQAGPASDSPATTTIVIDRTLPTISGVSAINGSYNPLNATAVNLTVSFSESVTVTGTPRLAITVGTATRYANYVSLADSKTATFRYTVATDQAEVDLDGILLISPLESNTGTIADLATNEMTNFSFTVPNTASVYINQAPAAPNIDSITANNTSLTVYFTAGSSNGSTVSNYKYSLNGGAFTALSPTDTISPTTITGLTNGINYQIQIRAVSNLGDGVTSNLLSASPTASVTLSISLTASATTANKGTVITITAAITQAGKVTFLWNGERIPGCISKPATTSATCQWKPNVTGQWSIQAFIKPTDTSYVDSYSPKLPVFILRRSGTR